MELIKTLLETIHLTQAVKLLEQGGFVVAILLCLSIFATTIILIKCAQIFWMSIGSKGSSQRAVKLWLEGYTKEAYFMVEGSRNPTKNALAHLMRGLKMSDLSRDHLREDVERVAQQGLGQCRSLLRPLESVVQIAPLLGLFGTVLGMIEAFQTLQNAGSEADPAVLAGGIWVALLTTAVGLAVAIPVAFVLTWFEGRIEAERLVMEEAITSLLTGRKTEEREDSTVTATAGDPLSEPMVGAVGHAT